jgi:probable HAF family extracellular repeat protein
MLGFPLFRAAAVGLGALAIAVSAPAAVVAAPTTFTIRDLGTLGGTTSEAVAINDRGQVAGSSTTADGSSHAFVWTLAQGMRDLGAGEAVDINVQGQVAGNDAGTVFLWSPRTGRLNLGTLGGISATVTDLNDRGQLVGSIDVAEGEFVVSHAFRWDPRTGLRDLGAGIATVINASGQVAGERNPAGGEEAFFWDPRDGSILIDADPGGEVTGFFVSIAGINDRGQVIGTSTQAFLWDTKSGIHWLDTLDALSSDALDINERGVVVGRVQVPLDDVDHAYRWTRSTGMVDLTTGEDFAFSASSTAVNNAGDVVGWTMTSGGPAGGQAFIWTETTGLVYLGTLGGDFSAAVDISERGWVAGNSATSAGAQHAVVWIPSR